MIRDWFIAAIETNGSVEDCLASVRDELAGRLAFIEALKKSLGGSSPKGIDGISEISQNLKALENTLRFRLGILRPERPGAWFRAPTTTSVGPFSSSLLVEPVFAHYEPYEAELVREGLQTSFELANLKTLPFRDESPCLWRTLLCLNAELHHRLEMPAPFQELRLDCLPEGLPADLDSKPLRAFLLNVRGEALTTKKRLLDCYSQLKEASEMLWTLQIEQEATRTQRSSERRGANAAADHMRAEFARRRQARSVRNPKDKEALDVMGFDEYPSTERLRQRYRELAKKLHPDRVGGDDLLFKALTRAYSYLNEKLVSRPSL